MYSTDATRWRAYQFLDPFAADAFFVCNKINTHFCRPVCDAHPTTELHSEIKFVDTAADAVRLGYAPCSACNPTQPVQIPVALLLQTVREINASIGFVPPVLDDDDDRLASLLMAPVVPASRRMSVPAGLPKPTAVSKNDSEHFRLIDLACRHLAVAAAQSIFTPSEDDKKKGGKKRRGGVLGFKELAIKSKLSAWHFHRVFKSIIGLTPKTYGDMCWEYLEAEKSALDKNPALGSPYVASASAYTPSSAMPTKAAAPAASQAGVSYAASSASLAAGSPLMMSNHFATPLQYHAPSPTSGSKRVRDMDDIGVGAAAKRVSIDSPVLSPFTDLRLEELTLDHSARATSVPNLGAYAEPHSLSFHTRGLDMVGVRDVTPVPDYLPELVPTQTLLFNLMDNIDLLQTISPETVDDISPDTFTPVAMAGDVPFSMFDLQGVSQDVSAPMDSFVPEDYADLGTSKNDLFVDAFDHLMMVYTPEVPFNV